jgi:predicted O-linked N-acetylglucosamine transferase (SPINDLY family)
MAANDKRLALEQLQLGMSRHRVGEMGLAQSHYQRAAKLDPANADAWHLLGVVALQTGHASLAAKHLRTCIAARPDFAEAHNNLGVALRNAGHIDEAIRAFRMALQKRSSYVDAAFNLGIAYEAADNAVEADKAYRQALAWRGNHIDAAVNLGNLLRRHGRYAEALPFLETAHRLAPDRAQTNGNLALLLTDLGRYREAANLAERAVTIAPEQALWWKALGVAQRLQHDIERAIPSLREAIVRDATDAATSLDLVLALQEAGDTDEANAILDRVTPPQGFRERVRWMRELSLPALYRDDAEIDAARKRFGEGIERLHNGLKLDRPSTISEAVYAATGVAPFYLHYQPHDNTELQCRFGDLVARVMSSAAPEFGDRCGWDPRAHGGRTRVGIVSSHLMHHTVSRYFTSLICGLDPERFEVHVWYSGGVVDANTQRIAARAASFVTTRNDALIDAHEIRRAQLDVLVYPEIGMDPRHQALAALRLAPVQCALYGHPATSGSARIDYFLSGDAFEPPDADAHYRERLVRLPGIGAQPARPPPPGNASWLDAHANGRKLVLCLQSFIKMMPSYDIALARIAKESGACIGFFGRNPPLMRRFRARIESTFKRLDVDPDNHLAFLPVQTHADYLAGIAHVPLVLDSPFFSGGGTSLDAFSVGTPVMAWEGDMARGRQTSAMLRMMDLPQLIARDEDGYVSRCTALLADTSERNALADAARKRHSILFDDDTPVRAFADFIAAATPTR